MADEFDFSAVSAYRTAGPAAGVVTVQKLDLAAAQGLATAASWADDSTLVCADDAEFVALMDAAEAAYAFDYSSLTAGVLASSEKMIAELNALGFAERETIGSNAIAGYSGTTTGDMVFSGDSEFASAAEAKRQDWAIFVLDSASNDSDVKNFLDKMDNEDFGQKIATMAGIADNTGPIRTSASAAEDAAIEDSVVRYTKLKKK